jgi:2-polyprenyl-6-hydroxyphenyl methylase/3-demethylubiquinone-9 3-methyltransferase
MWYSMLQTSYGADHWSKRQVTDDGLERYLRANREAYNATKADLLDRVLGDVRGRQLLDYGGGAGYYGLRCARRGASVTLVDPAPAALQLATRLAERWGVSDRLTTQCATSVPSFGAQRFDVVVLKDVIEHIEDDVGTLQAVAQLQPLGGRLLLSTHNTWSLNNLIEGSYQRLWCGNHNWLGWDPTHVRFYSPRSISQRLRSAGYEPVRWASVYLIPYNVLSWLTLLRFDLECPWLSEVDRLIGLQFPFNRLGWNIMVCAERVR